MSLELPQQFPDDADAPRDPTLRPARDRGADDELSDPERYARAVVRRWKLVIAGMALGGALAFWYASRQPLMFQGVTTLLVVPPSQSTGAQVNTTTFQAIVQNGTLASQVIDELKLQGEVTPQAFVERALDVEEVRGTNIVRIKVTLANPELAAAASRRLAQKAIAFAQQITQNQGVSLQEQLKKYVDAAHDRLQNAEQELLTYKQRAQVELVKEDTDAMLKERGDLLQLVVDIEAERARLAAAEQEIKTQPPLLSAARAPAAEEALRRAQTGPPPRGEVDAQHLDLTNPFVNPVYQTLDFQIATSRTRIAALERQRDELVNAKKLGGSELAQLSELYRRQIEQARLQASYDLATRVYNDLALRYEQSRTEPLETTARLQVVDEALPPEHSLSRRRLQYGMFGCAAGFTCAVIVVFLWEGRGRRTARGAA